MEECLLKNLEVKLLVEGIILVVLEITGHISCCKLFFVPDNAAGSVFVPVCNAWVTFTTSGSFFQWYPGSVSQPNHENVFDK